MFSLQLSTMRKILFVLIAFVVVAATTTAAGANDPSGGTSASSEATPSSGAPSSGAPESGSDTRPGVDEHFVYPTYTIDESLLPFEGIDGVPAEQMWGVHHSAAYLMEVPDNWNGELLMWAHGFRGTEPELTVDPPPFREWLVANGYAWAASSYPRNDYDITAGVEATRDLRILFGETVREPDLTYLAGASMGGHVTAVSIEQYPWYYDGAMPVCGVLGDYELFDFFAAFSLVGQQLATGEAMFPVDAETYYGAVVPAIKAAMITEGGEWPLDLSPTGQQFLAAIADASGGARPNFLEGWAFWNGPAEFATGPGNFLFDLAGGNGTTVGSSQIVLDTTDEVYQLDLDPAISDAEQALNDAILRIEADPAARSTERGAPVPAITGDISMPVLTLHNLGDLFVNFGMEQDYAREVAANGNEDLLVQRAIRGAGHCDFTGEELIGGFADLVNWVKTGERPAGDNVLDPAVVAGADYGCTFTRGEHLAAAPCPG